MIGVPLALAACASTPNRINDVCAVFDQRDGWFNDWQSSAERTQRKYGVPVHVLMATVRKESGFNSYARPPRRKLPGFIPWGRISSAYGFSQALDGTWSQYRRETGNFTASRTNFGDAVDFVGWYHSKTIDTFGVGRADSYGVARTDTYNLYLAYYLGWGSYKRGEWRSNAGVQRYARDTAAMADRYRGQLQNCR